MKLADVAGFAAIFGAGYVVGKDMQAAADGSNINPGQGVGPFSYVDLAIVVILLVFGFYLAVVLS